MDTIKQFFGRAHQGFWNLSDGIVVNLCDCHFFNTETHLFFIAGSITLHPEGESHGSNWLDIWLSYL